LYDTDGFKTYEGDMTTFMVRQQTLKRNYEKDEDRLVYLLGGETNPEALASAGNLIERVALLE